MNIYSDPVKVFLLIKNILGNLKFSFHLFVVLFCLLALLIPAKAQAEIKNSKAIDSNLKYNRYLETNCSSAKTTAVVTSEGYYDNLESARKDPLKGLD